MHDELDVAAAASLKARVAGAPISWGVCEVPGWGYPARPGAC